MIAEPWEVFATQTVNERHFAGMGAEQCCRCEGPALVEFYRWDNVEGLR